MSISVLIPTIMGREREFDSLVKLIRSQSDCQIVVAKDDKEISIGAKRQYLLENCKTEYFVMIDDDDKIPEYYFEEVTKALESNPDCVCYLESATMDGKEFIVCHSNRFNEWGSGAGYSYIRTPFYKDVLRTDIALKVGFKDLRYGEDHEFSKDLKKSGLIKTEVFIDKVMYIYTHNSMNAKQHKERYGIQ